MSFTNQLTINHYMTEAVHTLSKNHTLFEAKRLMKEFNIRHVPILEKGKIAGILSERDIDFLVSHKNIDIHLEKIEQAMTDEPIIVTPNTLLDEVCREMASKKVGSVLIGENQKIQGIFTWIDALSAFGKLSQTTSK